MKISIQTTSGGCTDVFAEVPETSDAIRLGLAHRTELPADHGMFFVLGAEDDWAFWMCNTRFPLDMIFINAIGDVVGIVKHAQPYDETPRSVGAPSAFVLEVNGGWADLHGVEIGAKVWFG